MYGNDTVMGLVYFADFAYIMTTAGMAPSVQ